MPRARHAPRSLLALAALGVSVLHASACRRTPQPERSTARDAAPSRSERDAHSPVLGDASTPGAAALDATPGDAQLEPFGPPSPWGDGAIPDSTATGPEAAATRAHMVALRASIGFWRIERNARTYCPTLTDLARTPGAMFDRSTMERDAWGTPFTIDCLGARVRIRSFGPDRTADTPDDIIAP